MKAKVSSRGLSLIGVLLLGSLMLTLGFTVAAMTFSHFTLTNVAERSASCRSLAEAAANRAIARCLADITYGTHNNFSDDITVTLESAPGGWGKVYFGGSDPVTFGNIPRSHNFLSEDFPQQSTGRVVPSRSLHVIAVSQWGKSRQAIETIVSVPQYKYAIASTGNITASGGLLVAGVKNPAAVEEGVSLIPDDQWAPGCMLSNSGDAMAALDLDSGAAPSRITGDIQAAGGIKLGPNTTVEGNVKAFQTPETVPSVNAEDYDTQMMSGCNTSVAANEGGLHITGPARRGGDLSVTGGLTLEDGILYVDGDVSIHGGLHGKGALVASGKVEVFDQSQFKAANDQAAIVAKSDVAIHGSNKENCVYNGVIFTKGDFQANDVTLLGSLCAGNATGSQVHLDKVNLLSNPISLNLEYAVEGPLQQYEQVYRYSGKPGVMDYHRWDYGLTDIPNLTNFLRPLEAGNTSANMRPQFEVSPGYATLSGQAHVELNLMDGKSRLNSDYTGAWEGSKFSLDKYKQSFPMGLLDGNARLVLPDVYFQGSADWHFENAFNGPEIYRALRGHQPGDSEPATSYWLQCRSTGERKQVTLAQVFNPDDDPNWASNASKNWVIDNLHFGMLNQDQGVFLGPPPYPVDPWALRNGGDRNSQNEWVISTWLKQIQGVIPKLVHQGTFNFNPLQFVQLRDQSQRILWREYQP